jgi:hypothetical protein
VTQQEATLARVRDFAVSRRGTFETATSSAEGMRLWNILSEVYNLTLIGDSTQLKPLELIR